MTAQLIFVHGRSQQHKNSTALKQQWIEAFKQGLDASGLTLPVPEDDIHFPYYGDTLDQLSQGVPDAEAAKVVIRGTVTGDQIGLDFIYSVLREIQHANGIPDTKVQEMMAQPYVERGILQWEWVQGILAAIDRYVPGASGAAIALATYDAYQYLRNPRVAQAINDGVRKAFAKGGRLVVVGHSLGSIICYKLLREFGVAEGWSVPLFVTLGSPLAITAIKEVLKPIASPDCINGCWLNGMDQHDVVALYPLDKDNFPVVPPIKNDVDIRNGTPNHHGIAGYLNDPYVAMCISGALKGGEQPAAPAGSASAPA